MARTTLNTIIRKNVNGKKLTDAERKVLADFAVAIQLGRKCMKAR